MIGLSILGAVLVGLGIITFFAANWDEIPRSVKLGALIAGVVLSYGAGFFLWQRLGYTAVGIALVLLGCIIYGAGGASHRSDLPRTRRPSQSHRLLVPWGSAPSLRHPFRAGDVTGNCPVPRGRRVPIAPLAGGRV